MGLVRFSKTSLQRAIMLVIAAAALQSVHADTTDSEIQQLRAEVQELRNLIKQQNTQPAVVQAAPSVASESKVSPKFTTSSGSEVKLYGFVRGDVSYQAEGGTDIFNRINAVSLTGENDDKFYSTASTTRLGLDFKAPIADANVGGKVEIDFRGSNESVRIRHAYLTYNNWLVGQTTSNFSSLEVLPEIMDFNLNVGAAFTRTPMVRYSNLIQGTDTKYFVGLEKGANDNQMPTLTAKINTPFADNKGLMTTRALLEENRAGNVNDLTTTGWAVGLGASYKIAPSFKIMGDYAHVKGSNKFSSYSNTAFSVDTVQDALAENEFDSLYVGATYQINPKLRSTLGFGAMYAKDNNDYARLNPLANEKLEQGWLNLMYNPVSPLTFGVEYIYGERQTFDGQKGADNRVSGMARYNF